MLPDHIKADDDGPTCSNKEKGAKRMRSACTTLRSVSSGTDPDEYGRVMGVTSVGSRKTVRFGEEIVYGFEVDQNGVANNSVDLDETQEEVNPCREDDSGAGGSSRGFGSASLTECLNGMGVQLNTANPATCAFGEGNAGSLPHADPRQGVYNSPCKKPRSLLVHWRVRNL